MIGLMRRTHMHKEELINTKLLTFSNPPISPFHDSPGNPSPSVTYSFIIVGRVTVTDTPEMED